MKPQKFIIYDNIILLGRVNLHKHLLPDNFNQEKIKGGGLFTLNKENKTIILYGKSEDFGPYDQFLIQSAQFENPKLHDFKRIYR